MEGTPTSCNIHLTQGLIIDYSTNAYVTSVCHCSKYLCQSMVEELDSDVSTRLLTATTMEERGKGRGRSEGDRWEGGGEGGRGGRE